MLRYGIVREKDPREIVLLRGAGCFYRKCAFCDHHLDACSGDDANVMRGNTTPAEPDEEVVALFMKEIYPKYKDDQKADILVCTADLTVGRPE